MLLIGHSYDRDTTKGGNEDAIPLHPELVPYLEHAMSTSVDDHVFQIPGGVKKDTMTTVGRDAKLNRILRTALRRAGLVTGFKLHCRRKGCGYKGDAADYSERRCPKAHPTKPGVPFNFKLQAVGLPKRMTFHGLRHTTASLLLMAGVPIAMVSRMLRHSSIAVTERIYAHLAPDWLHEQLQRMSFQPRLVEPQRQNLPKNETVKASDV